MKEVSHLGYFLDGFSFFKAWFVAKAPIAFALLATHSAYFGHISLHNGKA